MSQHDFNIANQTFPSFRADLNDALQAAATISAGATAPTTPYAYQLWFDTSTNTYKARNAANSAWVSLFGNDLSNAGITLGDNDKAIFGADSDLQIYHDATGADGVNGAGSYIEESGAGNLWIMGSQFVSIERADGTNRVLQADTTNGDIELKYQDATKLATTATGVDVTGTVTATGLTSTNNGVTLQSASVTKSALNVASSTNQGINGTAAGDQYNWTTGGKMLWSTNSGTTAHLVLDSSGNLLVGGTSPSQPTKVGLFGGSNTSRLLNLEVTHTTPFGAVGFVNGNGVVGSISMYSTSVTYNTSSDYRLKENITEDWDATTRLKQLNPVRFNFIADADTTVDGFLAHEVQDVVPEAITGTKDGMMDEEYEVTPAVEATYDDEGNILTESVPAVMGTRSVPDYQGIDQSKLVPLLVKTIQELEARITALEAS